MTSTDRAKLKALCEDRRNSDAFIGDRARTAVPSLLELVEKYEAEMRDLLNALKDNIARIAELEAKVAKYEDALIKIKRWVLDDSAAMAIIKGALAPAARAGKGEGE